MTWEGSNRAPIKQLSKIAIITKFYIYFSFFYVLYNVLIIVNQKNRKKNI